MVTMPEGDTVWLAGRRLHDALAGQRLTRTDFRVPQLATADLAGRVVREVVSRGKHLLTRIDDDLTLHTHFRMDGTWHLYRPGDRWRGGPDWQVRVVLATDQWRAVGYRLPVVELLARADEHHVVGLPWSRHPRQRLGTSRRGTTPSDGRTGPEIGEAPIDQRNLAGIGNLYKAESLYLARRRRGVRSAMVPTSRAVADHPWLLLTTNRDHPWQVTTGVHRRGRRIGSAQASRQTVPSV